jgi:alpha-L-fucosidase
MAPKLYAVLTSACVALAGAAAFGGETNDAATAWPAAEPVALARWQAMRFGMFIHWGPVSITGREIGWSRGEATPIEVYDNLYTRFNPTNFNADDWVSVAKAAGMKYVVLTTKHHDGFCLWDTRQTDYNIMNSPFHRDVVKELSAACKRQGLAFGAYHSVCDWHHPAFPMGSPGGKTRKPNPDLKAYDAYLRAEVSELITNYGPLVTLWFDVPQVYDAQFGLPLVKMARRLQPDILINDRAYKSAGPRAGVGDFDTPEQHVGNYQHERPWETCMTLGTQWAWKPNDPPKSLKQCLQTLVACAGGDGNLLFNVGPTPEGIIETRQIERLREMGAWLAKNGDSIYSTRGGPWQPGSAIASTRKGNSVFVHVFHADEGRVELPDLPRKVKSAKLTVGGPVNFEQRGGTIRLSFDKAAADPIDTIIRLELDGSAMDLPALTPGKSVQN